VDVRIITATHRDLEERVREGSFREDLYFRLNVIELHLPPLRDRDLDVLALAHHFVRHYAARSERAIRGISPEAGKALLSYEWPGNVRELKNYMERAVVLALQDEITPEDLPPRVRGARSQPSLATRALDWQARLGVEDLPTMEELEVRYIQLVLEQTEGNKSQAARILGFDRTTLYRKIERYEIEPEKEHS